MKTLYESILSSNKVGVIDEIKRLIINMPSDEDQLKLLNKLWNGVGLDLDGFYWSMRNSVLCFGKAGKDRGFIYRPVRSVPQLHMFAHVSSLNELGLTDDEIKTYVKKICKILKASQKNSGNTYDIKFE